MLTDKERMELMNLRKRVKTQREEIKRLQAELKRYDHTADSEMSGREICQHNDHLRTEPP